MFSPDENASNRLQAVYAASKKTWNAEIKPEDYYGIEIASDSHVMEILSEHTLEGWFEGYILTGRHGFFATDEALIVSFWSLHMTWSVHEACSLDSGPFESVRIVADYLMADAVKICARRNGFTRTKQIPALQR